jgi:hypothetical protein
MFVNKSMQKYIKIFRKLSLIMTLKVKISRKSDIEMTSGIIIFFKYFSYEIYREISSDP